MAEWDGKDDAGRQAKPGVDFHRVHADALTTSRSVTVVR